MAGMEQVFFANSGAEANEAAIKLTRLFGHKKGIETPSIIVMENVFPWANNGDFNCLRKPKSTGGI